MLSVICRIMMFYGTDVLEIKCDFFFILSSKLSKKTYDRPGCYLSAKGKCQNKKPLVFICAAFDVRFNTMGMHPPPQKRARGDEVGISRAEV